MSSHVGRLHDSTGRFGAEIVMCADSSGRHGEVARHDMLMGISHVPWRMMGTIHEISFTICSFFEDEKRMVIGNTHI